MMEQDVYIRQIKLAFDSVGVQVTGILKLQGVDNTSRKANSLPKYLVRTREHMVLVMAFGTRILCYVTDYSTDEFNRMAQRAAKAYVGPSEKRAVV